MPFVKSLRNILKLNFLTYDWLCADGSQIVQIASRHAHEDLLF